MQTRGADEYIFTGVLHWHLQTVPSGTPLYPAGESPGLIAHISQYLSSLTSLGLDVTSNAVGGLQGVRDELSLQPAGTYLDEVTAIRIRGIAIGAQQALYAEAKAKQLFVVTEKRFPVRKLLYDVPSLLRAGSFNRLPIAACIDLMSAGRCLAFECNTASAFLSLRSTEGVLRHYYSCVVKRDRVKEPWGWKAMTDQLERRRRDPPPKTLLDGLDALRDNFRNPTAHPEKHYDVEEAQELFGSCIDVIGRLTHAPGWIDPAATWGTFLADLQARAQAAQQGPPVPAELGPI